MVEVKELYFSSDVESDGPLPGVNSMLSIGCAAFEAGSTKAVAMFSRNLELLEGAVPDPKTMAWWNRPENQTAWKECRTNPRPPSEAMTDFVEWVESVCRVESAKPVFVAYPAGYDFLFAYYYMIRYAGRSPFSFQALDVKTFAMAVLGTNFRDVSKKTMPSSWFGPSPHTHVALDDAIEQGVLFVNMLRQAHGSR